jgi:hypothetical protein
MGACASPEADGDGPTVATDSSLAVVLADLYLADARAETTGDPADSLRAAALALHGLDSAAFEQRFADATTTPADAAALARAASQHLSRTAP